jgi:hypothetical protein
VRGVLAMTIGWYIIVPPFVSAWRTVAASG